MSRRIRIVSLVMAIFAFFYFCCGPMATNASAVAVVDDAVIAIIIAALAAMGITFVIDGTYYTAFDWISGIIDEMGISFSGINYGVNSRGNILLNNRFTIVISTIATYIRTKYSLTNNATHNVITHSWIVVDELTGYQYTPGTFTSYDNFTMGTPLCSFWGNVPNGAATNFDYRFNGTYYRLALTYNRGGDPAITMFTSADGVNWDWQGGAGYSRTDFEWRICLFYENGDIYLYMAQDNVNHAWKVVKFTITGIAVGENLDLKTGVLDIPTDQEIGDDGGILTLPVPWGETLPEVIEEIPTLVEDGALEGNTELDLDTEEAVTDQIDQAATNAQIVSQNPDDYQALGLPDVFPFCIPFDIYSFLSCLAADPEAPSFEWRFYVPGVCDETIEIDLSPFNTVAQILRTMELLLFIVGLAYVTREKYIRG